MPLLSNQDACLEPSLRFNLLQLNAWPKLSDLLLDTAPHMTRICALLARKPSTGMLIPVILDIPTHIAYPLLNHLHAKGYISPVGSTVAPEQASHPSHPRVESESQELPAATVSFLGKLWQSLMIKN